MEFLIAVVLHAKVDWMVPLVRTITAIFNLFFWTVIVICDWVARTSRAVRGWLDERRFRRLSRGPCIRGDPIRAWEVARLSPEEYEDLWNAGLGEALRRWEFPDEEEEDEE
ncbi:uncharacterized protein LOC125954693 [Anopheles darlingi]|uniref:uncharacterized protein LOC125954693 n=1 Tax=Anopheles darlingi TaxID=43151 RepID=UPI0021005122|nr:uncharacterized protein LOC125954693 [Anopheles darlingi]